MEESENAGGVTEQRATTKNLAGTEPSARRVDSFLKSVKRFQNILKIGGVLSFGIVAWNAFIGLIDKEIGKKLSDPTILRKIAAESRPALSFNSNLSITSDSGASQFVQDIRIVERDELKRPKRIAIDFKRHFATEPILTSQTDNARFTPHRGLMHSWEFDVFMLTDGGAEDNLTRLYRLELSP